MKKTFLLGIFIFYSLVTLAIDNGIRCPLAKDLSYNSESKIYSYKDKYGVEWNGYPVPRDNTITGNATLLNTYSSSKPNAENFIFDGLNQQISVVQLLCTYPVANSGGHVWMATYKDKTIAYKGFKDDLWDEEISRESMGGHEFFIRRCPNATCGFTRIQ